MKKAEFLSEFAILMSYFKADLDKRVLGLYYEELKKYDYKSFKNAVSKILASRKYPSMPMVAEFVEAIEGDTNDKAIKAWDDVLYAMGRYGVYHSVAFKDRAIMKAIENIGGWIELNNKSENDLKWAKKEFLDAYKAFSGKSYAITHLGGITEQSNKLLVNSPAISLKLIGYKQPSCTLDSYLIAMKKQKPKTIAMAETALRIAK